METSQRQFQDGLAEANTDPDEIAERVWPTLVYGAEHPLARQLASPAGLKKVQREDLRNFYQWPGASFEPSYIMCSNR